MILTDYLFIFLFNIYIYIEETKFNVRYQFYNYIIVLCKNYSFIKSLKNIFNERKKLKIQNKNLMKQLSKI